MRNSQNQGGPQTQNEAACNHTENYKDSRGNLLGTWCEVPTANFIRVQCTVCLKVYGTIPRMSEEEARRAYLEQQKRLSCPGCGESPFLG